MFVPLHKTCDTEPIEDPQKKDSHEQQTVGGMESLQKLLKSYGRPRGVISLLSRGDIQSR